MNFGNMGNLNQMMKQAREMQAKLEKSKQELSESTFSATSGGGMVEVTLNGDFKLVGVKINPAVVDPDDVETLEDLFVSAMKLAEEKVDAARNEKLGQFGGMF